MERKLERDITAFLKSSREIGPDLTLTLSLLQSKRREREDCWQYKAKSALIYTQHKVGLAGFTPRRIRKIVGRIEKDVDRLVDPVLAPILDPLVNTLLYEY